MKQKLNPTKTDVKALQNKTNKKIQKIKTVVRLQKYQINYPKIPFRSICANKTNDLQLPNE